MWPNKALVGYWGTWNRGLSPELPSRLSQFADYYNVIVASFLSVKGHNVEGFADSVNESYFQNALDEIHSKGTIMLASTGGWNNTWHATLKTSNDAKELAVNIVRFLIDHNLDGFDFNLEASAVNGSDDWISNIKKTIDHMRNIARNNQNMFLRGFYITESPQTYRHSGTQGSIFWAATGARHNFQSMLSGSNHEQPRFDALLIQNYNNFDSSDRKSQPPTLCMQIASRCLANAGNNSTKVIIGVDLAPCDKSYVTPAELQEAYEKEDNNGKALKSYNNFGGFMVLSLGQNPTEIDSLDFGKQVRSFYFVGDNANRFHFS